MLHESWGVLVETDLHAVRRSGLAELARLPHDLVILCVGGLEAGALSLAGGVGRGAEVLQTGLLSVSVEQGGCQGCRGADQGGCGEGGDAHLDLCLPGESLGSSVD